MYIYIYILLIIDLLIYLLMYSSHNGCPMFLCLSFGPWADLARADEYAKWLYVLISKTSLDSLRRMQPTYTQALRILTAQLKQSVGKLET